MTQPHQIILLAHGSSDIRWCETFEKLAEPTVQSIENAAIAYMELAEPSLDTIIAQASRSGARRFTVVPLFLAAGRHLRKDVPAMIEKLEAEHQVSIRLAEPIGTNPKLGLAIREVVRDELGRAES
ncbi:CbiX/SirB N-terminal domain-containing protein [Marinobacter daepoensis]|uniref:CbiX/SirB N-terminal domain-containing protein n=1 Tax=Marinobacter daepoensis TaxID=262077 RepID=A0ABS3BG67_9GAMM|nr:CbiX/SirB N-terminal domain-containing protein [Marinobacter daepoensis]MBN7769235.1 CbiX/SirB N-terminal domain-containing protein [Marinobacter daepoensis]MBY6032103.1 CbiX/SirB N-terminal domain-containing protein [Marinobacter daepoensis]MBY6077925.1 CbiX/SirB N-terminal domain-containing protein [Marinobacter daepoensis]